MDLSHLIFIAVPHGGYCVTDDRDEKTGLGLSLCKSASHRSHPPSSTTVEMFYGPKSFFFSRGFNSV